MYRPLLAGFLEPTLPFGFPPLPCGLYTLNGIKPGPPDCADRCINGKACGADSSGIKFLRIQTLAQGHDIATRTELTERDS